MCLDYLIIDLTYTLCEVFDNYVHTHATRTFCIESNNTV
jgi:hypothetical protein